MQRDQAHRTNELLERIAIALEKVKPDVIYNGELKNTKDIPGFEGVLNDLDNLYQPTSSNPDPAGYGLSDKCLAANCDGDECTHNDYGDDIHNDYLNDLVENMNQIEYLQFCHEMGYVSNDANRVTSNIYELEYEECLGAIRQALVITGDSEYIAYAGGDEEAGRNFVIERVKTK